MSANKSPTVIKTYTKGEYLFRENDIPRSLFIIQSGSVSIRKSKGSAFVEIARIHSKEILGELSFFDRQPRSAAALAISDVEALEICFESLDKIYAGIPDYLKSIMVAISERLRKSNDTIRRLQNQLVYDPNEKTLDKEALNPETAESETPSEEV